MSGGPWQRVLEIVRRQADPDAHGPLADERLLARFSANGDPSAFELLVWRHGGLVLGTCRRLLRDAQLAEDAFQATFLALAKKPRAVRSGAALADWLHRVAVRVSIKLRTSASRLARNDKVGARNLAIPPDDAGRNEWNEIVDHEIDRLPERLRRAVVLCYLDGRTTEEASSLLGCPRGTVLSRLSTARERLRVSLTRRGVTLPAAGVAGLIASESPAALVPLAVRTALIETPPILLATVHGVFHAMTISKLKVATAVVLAIGFAGTGVGWVLVPGPGPGVVQADEPQKPAKPATQAKGLSDADASLALDKSLELILLAKQTLRGKLEQAEQDYHEFRTKNPFLLVKGQGGENIYLTRLKKIEEKRIEARMRKTTLSLQEALIQNSRNAARNDAEQERAAKIVLLTLHRRGVDVAALRAIVGATSTATEVVQFYSESLKQDLEDTESLVRSLDEMYEIEQKQARDVSNYEAIDERMRRSIQSNQALYDSIIKRISEIGLRLDSKK